MNLFDLLMTYAMVMDMDKTDLHDLPETQEEMDALCRLYFLYEELQLFTDPE